MRERVAGWPLVVGANRDEYRDRPWEGPRREGAVVAPRDLRAGGTWLALHDSGLFVAVTNRPDDDPDPDRPSRGLLAMDLAKTGDLGAARRLLEEETARVRRNAFHLILADATEAWFAEHPGPGAAPIPPGLHTVTNRRSLDELDHGGELDPVDVPPGTALDPVLEDMRTALRSHSGPEPICKHGEDRGTLSSTIVALPAPGSGAGPRMWFAPDAPCRADYEEVDLTPR